MAVAAASASSTGGAAAAPLDEAAERGKRIYTEGKGEGGTITAYVGRDGTPVPAFAVPCANCHGDDGLGRPEGGVVPPDITWSHLLKPYGHDHPGGRRHPAFTAETIARAVTAGVDPGGNALDVAMPRYAMAETDFADLLAYLRRLESDWDPGLDATRIRIGTVLPLVGPTASLGQAMKAMIEAYLAEVNAGGGIHGRRLELVVAGDPGPRAEPLAAMRRLVAAGDVFALVSGFTAGVESEVSALAEAEKVPLVGPFTMQPPTAEALDRFTFYLLSGLHEQARVLVRYAASRLQLDAPRFAVVHPLGGAGEAAAEAVLAEAAPEGWGETAAVSYPPDQFDAGAVVRRLAADDVEAVFFSGWRQELSAFLQAMRATDWRPYLLLPGSLASRALLDLPADLAGRVRLAYPSLPLSDAGAAGQEFAHLLRRYELPTRHLPAQVSAYAATKVLVEGLKRAGKGLSRRRLVEALESLRNYQPGLTPPLSFGPNRRVGALGAYVVAVDVARRTIEPDGTWIAVQEAVH